MLLLKQMKVFLLLLQGSLFYTRMHTNRWWTVTQEVLVLVHGTIVALSNAPGMWQMFCFGFAGLLVVTQMHGLGLSLLVRFGILFVYATGVTVVYSSVGLQYLHQITWIPLTEYGVVFVLAFLVWGALRLYAAVKVIRARIAAG